MASHSDEESFNWSGVGTATGALLSALVLLAMVFRSIWVPVKATAGYLLSVGAAFGVMVLVLSVAAVGLGELIPTANTRRAEILGEKRFNNHISRTNFVFQANTGHTLSVRRLDAERFELETASNDVRAGIPKLLNNTGNAPRPTPFTPPRREGKRLDSETGTDATDDAAR